MIFRNIKGKEVLKAAITIEVFKTHAEIHLLGALDKMGYGTKLLLLLFSYL